MAASRHFPIPPHRSSHRSHEPNICSPRRRLLLWSTPTTETGKYSHFMPPSRHCNAIHVCKHCAAIPITAGRTSWLHRYRDFKHKLTCGQYSTFIPRVEKHKRRRRSYEEIVRNYKCGWSGCEKGYGTLNHLNKHVARQEHGQKRTPEGMFDFIITSSYHLRNISNFLTSSASLG